MFARAVDVLIADLSTVEADEDLLSVSELGHALSLGSSESLPAYLAAHTWLRRRLAEYLGCSAADVEFAADGLGRSVVCSPLTDLTFDFAYAGGVAALVTGFRRNVGVAVAEAAGFDVPVGAERMLAPDERHSFAHAIDPGRTYLRFQVRKQALARANKAGLEEDSTATDVSGVAPVVVAGYAIDDILLGEQLVAAVATTPDAVLTVTLDDSMTAPAAERSRLLPAAVAS